MSVDFHTHSTASDGSCTPREVACLLASAGIKIGALTDHDTFGGGEEFLAECEKVGILGIVGIEFSTVIRGVEAHVLGYKLPRNDPRFSSFVASHHEYLRYRCEETLKKLAKFGYRVDIELVYEISGGNPAMPPHILKAMAQMGMISDFKEALAFFMEYLATNAKAWVPHETPIEKPITALNEAGAIPILSHPARYPGIDKVEEILEMGARGFELYYPTQTGQVFEELKAISEKYDCLVTGGSDFHGEYAERRIGEVEVPLEVAERLLHEIGVRFPVHLLGRESSE